MFEEGQLYAPVTADEDGRVTVHLADDPMVPLAGITVALKDPGTMETVAQVVTGADGQFSLGAPQVIALPRERHMPVYGGARGSRSRSSENRLGATSPG